VSVKPFEDIVAEHGETVLRVCRAVLGPVDADDAWSETFLSAMAAYPSLPPGSNVQAWLVTIAHRKAIDVTRVRSRAPIPVDDVDGVAAGAAAWPGSAASGVGVVAGPESASSWDGDLWNALRALPLRQREAVAYHYLVGLPYAEVAAVLGGSADAARRASADGIAALRRSYPQEGIA
jgi:RNA polymerase sigma factor, sigma-70 family